MKKIVVLNSGGFDSTLLLHFLKTEFNAELYSLYFSYGQTSDAVTSCLARQNAEELCKEHKCIVLPKIDWTHSEFYHLDYTSSNAKYLEARNLIFASFAASYAESIQADSVAMALIKDGAVVNNYPDTSKKFVKKLDRLFREFGLTFFAPFIDTWKDKLFNMGVYYNILPDSFMSCDVPIQGNPCGVCPDCKAIKDYISLYNSKK